MSRARSVLLGSARGVLVVLARELGATFESAIAYVTTIAGLLLVSSLYMNEFFLVRRIDLTPFFELLPPTLVLFLPAVTMRLWSEERKTRTFEFLATLPLTSVQTTLGKYLSALTLYALFLCGTAPLVVLLCALGDPDLGLIASGYVGALLLGAAFLAAGSYFSARSSDQVTAFVTTALIAFALLYVGHERVVAVLDGLWPGAALGARLATSLGALHHYERFVGGLVALDGVAFFVALTAVFLALTARTVSTERT